MIYDVVGIVGVTLVIYAYYLLQAEKISIKDMKYSVVNVVGSLLIMVSLFNNFNLSSFIIESFWVLISVMGIVRCLKNKNKADG